MARCRVTFERNESFRADVVFNAFGVGLGNFLGDAETAQKRQYSFMPSPRFIRQPGAFVRQEYRAIGAGGDITISLQSGDGANDRNMSHAKAAGQIHGSRLSLSRGKIGDGLHVILRGFRGVFEAGAAQGRSLSFG